MMRRGATSACTAPGPVETAGARRLAAHALFQSVSPCSEGRWRSLMSSLRRGQFISYRFNALNRLRKFHSRINICLAIGRACKGDDAFYCVNPDL